jgi:hypothetical protein
MKNVYQWVLLKEGIDLVSYTRAFLSLLARARPSPKTCSRIEFARPESLSCNTHCITDLRGIHMSFMHVAAFHERRGVKFSP